MDLGRRVFVIPQSLRMECRLGFQGRLNLGFIGLELDCAAGLLSITDQFQELGSFRTDLCIQRAMLALSVKDLDKRTVAKVWETKQRTRKNSVFG